MKHFKNNYKYIVISIAILLFFNMLHCVDATDPVQRTAFQVVFIGTISVIAIFCLAILAGIAKGSRFVAWIIFTGMGFLFIPDKYKLTIFSFVLGVYALACIIIFILGDFRYDPSDTIKDMLTVMIIMGLFFIIPWGILQALTSEPGYSVTVLGPTSGKGISFKLWFFWFVFKIIIPILVARFLDNKLESRGRRMLFRVFLRSVIIWIWAVIPFPNLGIGFFRELMWAGGISSFGDGILDIAYTGVGFINILTGFALAIVALISLPGVISIYANKIHYPLAALISIGFVTLTCRVAFLLVAYDYAYNN